MQKALEITHVHLFYIKGQQNTNYGKLNVCLFKLCTHIYMVQLTKNCECLIINIIFGTLNETNDKRCCNCKTPELQEGTNFLCTYQC